MLNQIIELVADELNLDSKTLTKETRLQEDLNVDSLDVVELVMKLEEEFNIEVTDEQAASLKTIEDILNFVEANK
ncbi:Acyl carrier protein [Alteracholeplasma palmae J233]|uniref:Acyl carrier protein n=1 Tax=Alteracholeplasma palmae (strain ATCC 49389 / J233) TaxID=1318466 RepID=U4KLG4_ALTPJ|nr:acyl carrier protein [Alteracholeplasma palmae]CCV64677.1 Acyl carrier protein [Alteracholeplasma palmae J233]